MSHAEVEELKEQLAAALSAQQTAERELERMRPIEAAAREFRLAWFDTMGCSEEREAVFRALDAASEGEKLCRHCGNPKNYPDHGDTIGRGHDFEPAPPKTEDSVAQDNAIVDAAMYAATKNLKVTKMVAKTEGGEGADEWTDAMCEHIRGLQNIARVRWRDVESMANALIRKNAQLAAAEAKNAELEQKVEMHWNAYVGAAARLKSSQERERIIQEHRERLCTDLVAQSDEVSALRAREAPEKAWERAWVSARHKWLPARGIEITWPAYEPPFVTDESPAAGKSAGWAGAQQASLYGLWFTTEAHEAEALAREIASWPEESDDNYCSSDYCTSQKFPGLGRCWEHRYEVEEPAAILRNALAGGSHGGCTCTKVAPGVVNPNCPIHGVKQPSERCTCKTAIGQTCPVHGEH